jgi:hypothetical protein
MVVTSVVLIKETLGGKNPLSVAVTSNLADALGVVVPIPVCAPVCVAQNTKSRYKKYLNFIIV